MCVRRRGGLALLVVQARDHGVDEGAVGHAVVAQGQRDGICEELDVVVQPGVGDVGRPSRSRSMASTTWRSVR
jgi:hypothetical protein